LKKLLEKSQGVFSGCFELNGTNEMCLKTEDFFGYYFYRQVIFL